MCKNEFNKVFYSIMAGYILPVYSSQQSQKNNFIRAVTVLIGICTGSVRGRVFHEKAQHKNKWPEPLVAG